MDGGEPGMNGELKRAKTGGRKAGTPNRATLDRAETGGPAGPRAGRPLRVEMWPLSRLVQYEANPRKNDGEVDRMAAAIREFGFRIPIVAQADGTIVDGHLRYKAARKLRLAQVPVALADGLDERQIRAFRLLANKSAEWASWDDDLLAAELGDLRDDGFDLLKTGFDLEELAALLGDEAEAGGIGGDPPVPKTIACPACGHVFAAPS